jgi:hypothetical protein
MSQLPVHSSGKPNLRRRAELQLDRAGNGNWCKVFTLARDPGKGKVLGHAVGSDAPGGLLERAGADRPTLRWLWIRTGHLGPRLWRSSRPGRPAAVPEVAAGTAAGEHVADVDVSRLRGRPVQAQRCEASRRLKRCDERLSGLLERWSGAVGGLARLANLPCAHLPGPRQTLAVS